MISLYDIQRFIINTLKEDNSFNQFAKNLFNKELSYFIDANVYMAQEELPSIVAFGINKETVEKEEIYIVQYILTAIQENENHVVVDGINEYPTKKNLEKTIDKSLELIRKTLREIGINNQCGFSIENEMVHLSDIGEANDIQAVASLQFVRKKTL